MQSSRRISWGAAILASLPTSVLEFQGEQTGAVTASLGLVNNINPTGGINGQGTASLTQDTNSGGAYSQLSSAPATYSISSAGRGVLNYTNAVGQPSEIIFYLDGTGFPISSECLVTCPRDTVHVREPRPLSAARIHSGQGPFPAQRLRSP